MNSIMEVWPMPQMPNTIRFVCKLVNCGQQHIYDCDKDISVTEFLLRINSLVIRDFNITNEYKLCFYDTDARNCILKKSNDILARKFDEDFVKLYVKPDYVYSIPECIFYNSGKKSLRISFLIKKDAAKTIQRFYRLYKQIECPCCFNNYGFSTYNEYYMCEHKICYICFNQWRERSETCPCCRAQIKPNYRRWRRSLNNTNSNNNMQIYTTPINMYQNLPLWTTNTNLITLMDNITLPSPPINNTNNISSNQPIENELLEIVEDLRYTISNSRNPWEPEDSDDMSYEDMPPLEYDEDNEPPVGMNINQSPEYWGNDDPPSP